MRTAASGDRGAFPEPLAVSALRDPARLAQWLVEVSAGASEARRVLAKSHLPHGSEHDDDEDGEEVDEEEAAADAIAQADARAADDKRLASVEDQLAALATAMHLASEVVDRLKLRMALTAGDQMRIQMHREDSDRRRVEGDTRKLRVVAKPGEPTPHARIISDAAACAKCQRTFSTFSRSKNCQSCGHSFCPKVK
ncbi:hypothetical protein P43SY_011452 [Pythium insidiosum]|uniref:FYVE-type domain-containing protein n=1 Tax=Pythium insidiosum TaxID=114742 RepID=A0AAD5LWW8_PYTIN|nr:hypothetical protein P43SY_011452 [Pythium insidiosum]